MKKLLITGGSHAEIPLIQAAKQLGFHVISTGLNVDGLGHREADEYVRGDFSDKEFVLSLAKKKSVDAMVSGCNDFAYLSTAYACEKLGLPGHDTYATTLIVHHKDNFRTLLSQLDIKTPKSIKVAGPSDLRDSVKALSFPVIMKPIDLTGGKGVAVCQTEEEAIHAFDDCMSQTREEHVIVEEYISGTNHGASVLLKNEKVVFSVFDDEQYYKNKYLVQGASMPSDTVSQAAIFTLRNDIEKVARALNLVDGLFHVQFIVDKSGYPVMIDPCRRAPGDLYILLAKYATEVDYPMEIVKAETGILLNDSYPSRHNFVARQCIMADRNGLIKDITVSEQIKRHLVHQMLWGKPDDEVSDFMKYKAGILIMQFASYVEMQEKLASFQQLAKIEFQC